MPSLADTLAAADDAIEIDLSGSVAFGDAPYGKYIARLEKWEQTTSKSKIEDGVEVGNQPMLVWYFHVEDTIEVAPDADTGETPEAPAKDTFLPLVRTMMSGAAAWRTEELYVALGGDPSEKNAQGVIKIRPKTVVNNLVRCVKQQQENNPQYDELTGFEKNEGKTALA